MFFSWLDNFFKLWNDIPWSGCTTAYLPIYFLKDFLFTSQVFAVMNKATINISVQVLCCLKFSTPLNKYQGVQ